MADVYWITFDKNDWQYSYDAEDGSFNVVTANPGTGAYTRHELGVDKEGNTTYYYQFVGEGHGDWIVTFRYAGVRNGQYSRISSGASYVAPTFVLKGDTLVKSDTYDEIPIPTRTGYKFDGWYFKEDCTGDKLKRDDVISDKSKTQQEELHPNNPELQTHELTVYAKWVPDNANYTIVIWQQRVTDLKTYTDDEKTYDFAGSVLVQNQKDTDAIISYSDVSSYIGYAGQASVTIGTSTTPVSFEGFHYNQDKTQAQGDVRVLGDGTSVYNVYYDRNLVLMYFMDDGLTGAGTQYYYNQATDYSGTQYALTENGFVELTPITKSVPAITWTRNNGNTYTGTVYSSRNQNDVFNYDGTNFDPTHTYYGIRNYTWITVTGTVSTTSTIQVRTGFALNGIEYNGTRYTRGNQVTAVTANYSYLTSGLMFTGLYGQTLEFNGYTWPSTIDGTSYNWLYTSTAGIVFLDAFVLPNKNSTTITMYPSAASGNTVSFFKQKIDGTYPDNNTPTNTAKSGAPFEISDKYNGFTAYEWNYEDNLANSWTRLGSKNSEGAYYYNTNTNQTRISTDYGNLYIHFKRNSYQAKFVDSKDPTVVFADETKLYEAPLSEFSSKNASKKADGSDFAGYEGRTFNGWYLDNSCTNYVFFTEPTAEQIRNLAKDAEDNDELARLIVLTQKEYDTLSAEKKAEIFVKNGKYYQLIYTKYTEMPANNLQFYAGWRINKYRVWIQANGGALVPGDGFHATYFNNTYDQLISKYEPVYANYVPQTAAQAQDSNVRKYAYVEIFGVSNARIALYVFKDGDKYYYYPNLLNNLQGPGNGDDYLGGAVELEPAWVTAAQERGLLDDSKFTYTYKYNGYSLVGWYKYLGPETLNSQTPPAVRSTDSLSESSWNFGDGVHEITCLRAIWKRNGRLTVHYIPAVESEDADGNMVLVSPDEKELANFTDQEFSYADNAQSVTLRAPALPGEFNSEWIFVGWQTPETDYSSLTDVIHEPGTTFTVHAQFAEQDPDDEYHFIYNVKAVYRQIKTTAVTYDLNGGTLDNGATLDLGTPMALNTANVYEESVGSSKKDKDAKTIFDLKLNSALQLSDGKNVSYIKDNTRYYLAGWSEGKFDPGVTQADIDAANCHLFKAGGIYGVSNKTTDTVTVKITTTVETTPGESGESGDGEDGDTTPTTTEVTTEKEIGTNKLYAVWMKDDYYYVFHSSTGVLEMYPVHEDNSTVDFTSSDFIGDDYYYGGYYSEFGGVKKDEVDGLVLATQMSSQKPAMADGKAQLAVGKDYQYFKSYTGEALYDKTMSPLKLYWSRSKAYLTEKATEVHPGAGMIYYLKEVPKPYLSSKMFYIYNEDKSNALEKIYLVTVIDDNLYSGFGMDLINPADTGTAQQIAGETYSSYGFQNLSGTVKKQITYKDFGKVGDLSRGNVCVVTAPDTLLEPTTFTMKPYWITLDGVKVYGEGRTITHNGTKDSISDGTTPEGGNP